MRKTIVKKHLRKGKPVRKHIRNVKSVSYGSRVNYISLEEMHAKEKWKKQFKPHGKRITEKEIGGGSSS